MTGLRVDGEKRLGGDLQSDALRLRSGFIIQEFSGTQGLFLPLNHLSVRSNSIILNDFQEPETWTRTP